MRIDVDKILQSIQEETTSANISYLPGTFTTVRQAVRSLGRMKQQWNINVLENEAGYEIVFEDALKVFASKDYYDHFNKNVVKVTGVKVVNLGQTLQEAIKEAEESSQNALYVSLVQLLQNNKHVGVMKALANYWINTFPKSKIRQVLPSTAIDLADFNQSSKVFVSKMMEVSTIGTMDTIVGALKSGRPLPKVQGFDHLVGVEIESAYEGVRMRLRMNLDFSLNDRQSIMTDNSNLIEFLGDMSNIKTVGAMIMPVGATFTPGFFGTLKEIIDDNVDEI